VVLLDGGIFCMPFRRVDKKNRKYDGYQNGRQLTSMPPGYNLMPPLSASSIVLCCCGRQGTTQQ